MRHVLAFYGRFAAAYGTCWLVMLLIAVLKQGRVDAGAFGFFGFPLIGFLYAIVRIWIPPPRPTAQGFDVVAPKPVIGLDHETAEELLARELGYMKSFVVKGVDRRTLAERTLRIPALSKDSAGVKAELEGLIVTVVYEQKGDPAEK